MNCLFVVIARLLRLLPLPFILKLCLPAGESDVELAGFTEGYVLVVNADCSLWSMELDPASVQVVVEDKGWCSWRVSVSLDR